MIEQKVPYEWEPVLCSKCKVFGHEDSFCRGQQQAKKVWIPKSKPVEAKPRDNLTAEKDHLETVQQDSDCVDSGKGVLHTVKVMSVESAGLDHIASSSDNGGEVEDRNKRVIGNAGQGRAQELIDKGVSPNK